jgi:F-box domain
MTAGDEELVDFGEVKAKLMGFTHRSINAAAMRRNKQVLKTQIFSLVEILLCKTIDDSGFFKSDDGDNFAKAMKDVHWYGPNCTSEYTDVIFVETFVTLASHYASSAPLLLEILTSAACNLNPPDRNHMLLRRILLGITEIIRFSSIPNEELLFGRSDKVLVQELLTGFTCIPSLASGKVFIILSLMRVAVELRYRSAFGFFLRKTLISIMSKTWLKQPLCRLSIPFNQRTAQNYSATKAVDTLSEVANNVTDIMYGDGGGNLSSTGSILAQLTDLLEPAILNEEVLDMGPQQFEDDGSQIGNDGNLAPIALNSASDATFMLELAAWKESCTSDPQLTSAVLARVTSWFSPISPTRLSLLPDGYERNRFIGSVFNTVVVDVVKWAMDATSVIFKDCSVSDVPLVIPSWTGVNLSRVFQKNKSSEKIHRLRKKYDSFVTKFTGLKTFILCCSNGSPSNIELLLDYLVTKVEKWLGIEVRNTSERVSCSQSFSEGLDFFRFFPILEFVIQLLCYLSPRIMELHAIVRITRRLTSIAQVIKQRISCLDFPVSEHASETTSPKSTVKIDGKPPLDPAILRSDGAKCNQDAVKCSVYAFVTLCSGIGYTVTQRFSCDDSVSFLLHYADWDVSSVLSSLFLCHHSGNSLNDSFVQNMCLSNKEEDTSDAWRCRYTLVAHPAVEIIMGVFFMPYIGTEDCNKASMRTLCTHCSRLQIDPKDDFLPLNLSNIFDSLPFSSATLGYLFVPTESSKLRRDKDSAAHLLPNLRYLSNSDFCRLSRQLASRLEVSLREEELTSSRSEGRMSGDGMDLSTFSKDVLVQILSFLSFKRVCRMACVSSGVSEASKETSLWEILYKRKFRNFIFENYVIKESAQSMMAVLDCEECIGLKPSASRRGIKKRKQKACHFDCRRHSWMDLFQVSTTATTRLHAYTSPVCYFFNFYILS